ncbi:MAG: helix-hairpin-helix domain-containing protein [Lachnospiraceae bacterium]|nr:helix-hairpin-helix domain-containing protein [Lachnospiraceae bacterium]
MKKLLLLLTAAVFLCGCDEPTGREMMKELTFEEAGEDISTISSDMLTEIAIESAAKEVSETEREKEFIYVHVCGAVVLPGVYKLPAGSRAYEAVDAAGGVTDDAAPYLVNLAGVLCDEQKLYIPKEGEDFTQEEYAQAASARTSEKTKVNINTATKEQLMTLNGVGQSKADAIISYREKNGSFKNIEQIMEVNGIKNAAFERIKEDITV